MARYLAYGIGPIGVCWTTKRICSSPRWTFPNQTRVLHICCEVQPFWHRVDGVTHGFIGMMSSVVAYRCWVPVFWYYYCSQPGEVSSLTLPLKIKLKLRQKYSFFLKIKIWRTSGLFVRPLMPLFWTSVDICLCFKAKTNIFFVIGYCGRLRLLI